MLPNLKYRLIIQCIQKQFVLLFLFLFLSIFAVCQSNSDSILMLYKNGTMFMQHNKKYYPRETFTIIKKNADAIQEIKTAILFYNSNKILEITGGLMLGWPLGNLIDGTQPNWAMSGVGAALILVSIPINNTYILHIKKALNIYNSPLNKSVARNVSIYYGLAPTGIKLKLSF